MKKVKLKAVICFCFIVAMLFPTIASATEKEEIRSNQIAVGPLVDNVARESGYYCTVIGNGVYFRSSPYISSNNIIRTLYAGHRLWVYQSGINVAYNNGYYWSYLQDLSTGDWGYMASKYFSTDSWQPKTITNENVK